MTLSTHFHIHGYEIFQPMVTQHTGSLNKYTKPQRSKKPNNNRDENNFKYLKSPPRICALPFLNERSNDDSDFTCIKRGAPTSSIGFSELIQLQPLGLKESFTMHDFPWRHGLKNGKTKKKKPMNKYLNNGTAKLVRKIKEGETRFLSSVALPRVTLTETLEKHWGD